MPGHVVFLECYPHVRGGAQATTAALATALPAWGWTVEVVAPFDGPALDALRTANVRTTVLDAPGALLQYGGDHRASARSKAAAALPAWWTRLARHLRRSGASLLDVVDERGIILGAPAAAAARVRGVWHVHTPGDAAFIDRLGRRWARTCIAPSHAVASRLGRDAVVVAPAIPPISTESSASFEGRAPRLVSAGRLHPVKWFDVLIAAVATLRARMPDLTLDVYGAAQAGHEAHALALESQVARLGLHDVVRFLGHQPCPWTQWNGAAAYVQPSRKEPFGMALVEAMASCLPVIATRVDGPAEIVDDGRTGLLVPPDDPDALARAIERVLLDHDLARALATAGRAHARSTYTVEHLVERTAAVFDRAVA